MEVFEIVAKGRIHSFETFGTVDGPGIRFVVFMQGCPLRCIYCHNRDTWDRESGNEFSSEDVLEQVKKYLNYIRFSGGGITVSGGEPLLQAEFVAEIFKGCRELGIHTALDTSGFADIEKVKELLDYTDLILLDLKHADEEKHRTITGIGREKITTFAEYAAGKGIPIWIRYVLLPGYTDSEKDLLLASEFIKSIKSVEKIEVLPYHSMGAHKWTELGFDYALKGVREPTAEEIERAERILGGL